MEHAHRGEFDFNADIYGEKITICMTEFIRSEQKFENSAMLD